MQAILIKYLKKYKRESPASVNWIFLVLVAFVAAEY